MAGKFFIRANFSNCGVWNTRLKAAQEIATATIKSRRPVKQIESEADHRFIFKYVQNTHTPIHLHFQFSYHKIVDFICAAVDMRVRRALFFVTVAEHFGRFCGYSTFILPNARILHAFDYGAFPCLLVIPNIYALFSPRFPRNLNSIPLNTEYLYGVHLLKPKLRSRQYSAES